MSPFDLSGRSYDITNSSSNGRVMKEESKQLLHHIHRVFATKSRSTSSAGSLSLMAFRTVGRSNFSRSTLSQFVSQENHQPSLRVLPKWSVLHHHDYQAIAFSKLGSVRTFHLALNSTVYDFASLCVDISLHSNAGICTDCRFSLQALHKHCRHARALPWKRLEMPTLASPPC